MTDYAPLDNAVTAIRTANPKIAAAFDEVEKILKTVAPPTPPPSKAWAWDATQATLDPNSAAKITAFLSYSTLPTAYLSCDVATVDGGSTSYAVQGVPTGVDSTVTAPANLHAGCSSDHHLRVNANGRETDLWQARVSGNMITASGGRSFASGAAQEPTPGGSNAARFPLARGLITPADIQAGVIAHPLVFSMPAASIGGPCVYPANQVQNGPGNGLVFGQWLRLDHAFTLPTLPQPEQMVTKALQSFGMFLRDGGSNVAFYGQDAVNQGGNASAYPAGFLPIQVAGYPYARKLNIPLAVWQHLQVLEPPSS